MLCNPLCVCIMQPMCGHMQLQPPKRLNCLPELCAIWRVWHVTWHKGDAIAPHPVLSRFPVVSAVAAKTGYWTADQVFLPKTWLRHEACRPAKIGFCNSNGSLFELTCCSDFFEILCRWLRHLSHKYLVLTCAARAARSETSGFLL